MSLSQAMWDRMRRRDVKRWVPWAPLCGSQSMRRQTVAPRACLFKNGWSWLGVSLGISLVFFWRVFLFSPKFHPLMGFNEIVLIVQDFCSSFCLQMHDAIDFEFSQVVTCISHF